MKKFVHSTIRVIVGLCIGGGHGLAHDWGGFQDLIKPTTVGFHGDLGTLVAGAQGHGFNLPDLEGTAGGTTIDGVEIFEMETSVGAEEYGAASLDQPGAIAFSSTEFTLEPPDDKVDYPTAAKLFATWSHEKAHVAYTDWYEIWCASAQAACDAYQMCIEGLGYSGGAQPCDEAYAWGMEKKAICDEYKEVCVDENLSETEKTVRKLALNDLAEKAHNACARYSLDCQSCGGGSIHPPNDPGCGNQQTCKCGSGN